MYKVLLLIFVAIGVALAIWGLIVLKNQSDENNQQDIASEIQGVSPAYELTSKQLEAEYDTDEEVAQKKYKGEVVRISGFIRFSRMDASPAFITFTSDDFLWDVRCRMPDSQAKIVSSLIRDHRVPAQGTTRQPNIMIALVGFQMKGRVGSHKSLVYIEIDGCTFEQILR